MAIESYEESPGVNPEQQEQNTANSEADVADQEQQAGEQSNDRLVPLEVVQSIREENKEWKDRAKKLEQYIYQQQQEQQQQESQQSNDPLSQMDDDEFLTAGQARQLLDRQQQQNNEMVREVKMRQQYSDYDEVIGQYLPQLIEQKPHLRDAILSSQDPYNLAYELGSAQKQQKQMSGQQESQQEQNVESSSELNAALDRNSQKPGSLSQSSGAAQGSVSQADLYSGMSPSDFDEEIRKAKRGQ